MKIYRCVKTDLLTQGYGVDKTKPELIPLYNSLGFKGHEGFDFAVDCKDRSVQHGGQCEQVYCDLDIKAKVTEIQKSDEYGFGVVAVSEDLDGIFQHLWWHFDVISPDIKVGTIIESGDLLGTAGNTGRSTGAHLHRELRPMAKDTYGNLYKSQINNGYGGAVDIAPYFENVFILEKKERLIQTLTLLQKLVTLLKEFLK